MIFASSQLFSLMALPTIPSLSVCIWLCGASYCAVPCNLNLAVYFTRAVLPVPRTLAGCESKVRRKENGTDSCVKERFWENEKKKDKKKREKLICFGVLNFCEVVMVLCFSCDVFDSVVMTQCWCV